MDDEWVMKEEEEDFDLAVTQHALPDSNACLDVLLALRERGCEDKARAERNAARVPRVERHLRCHQCRRCTALRSFWSSYGQDVKQCSSQALIARVDEPRSVWPCIATREGRRERNI